MYLPPHFAAPGEDDVAAFVDSVGAADLVTYDGSKPVASLIPVIWDRAGAAADGHGRLLGHLALANPQWQSVLPGAAALAIVHGPQAYVSPSWYPSRARHGRVVPTWNYITVHFTGPLTIHRDPEWLRAVVTRLTSQHEAARSQPWAVTDAPPAYIEGQLRGIIGVELVIASVEAKYKLSQNRDADDQAGAIEGLRREPGAGPAAAVADAMAGGAARAGPPARGSAPGGGERAARGSGPAGVSGPPRGSGPPTSGGGPGRGSVRRRGARWRQARAR